MSNNKCPCEECISFAICYNVVTIYCEDLYRFICSADSTDFRTYKKNSYIPKSIYALYNKYISSTIYFKYRVHLKSHNDYHENLKTHAISCSHERLLEYYRRNV